MYHRWQGGRDRLACLDQVANAPDSSVDLTPVSEAPAEHVRAGWAPWLRGQAVPLLWERVAREDECQTL